MSDEPALIPGFPNKEVIEAACDMGVFPGIYRKAENLWGIPYVLRLAFNGRIEEVETYLRTKQHNENDRHDSKEAQGQP